MRKYVIHYNYFATADVTVLANSEEEAIKKAEQIEIPNDGFYLEYDNKEVCESEEVPDLQELIDKADAIIRKFDEGAGKDDFYKVPCYPTITTLCWDGDKLNQRKNVVENFYYDKGIMLDMGEGFDVELAELTDIDLLNVCQVIIDSVQANGVEL